MNKVLATSLLFLSLSLTGCFGLVEDPSLEKGGEFIGEGGKTPTGSGGASAGASASGGSAPVDTAGASGAVVGTGGAYATGGMTGSGGEPGTTGSGGARVDGGTISGSGGMVGTGGGAGGRTVTATGGMTGTGGVNGTGGAVVAAVCTSRVTYTSGTGSQMRPGANCRSCHGFTISGTVYPTLHEPLNCNGVNGSTGVRVVITGANGAVLTLTPSGAGNFYSNSSVTFPITAKITNGASTRAMTVPQRTGDCNSCHSQNGANGAPGRIMTP